MSARLEGSAIEEWRRHWAVVVAASAGMGMAAVISFAAGLFIAPLEKEFGWSRTEISSAHMISAVAIILLAPFVGYLVDRFGPRRLGIVAVIAVALGLSLFSLTGPNIWTWRLLWVSMAAATVIIQPLVWTSAITGLFSAGRGLALAFVLCGSSICSIVTPPLTWWLIENYGWRLAFVGIGVSWGSVVLPLVLLFFTSAQDTARRETPLVPLAARPSFVKSFRGDVLTWRFMQLALAGFCIAIAVVSVSVTIVPILSSNGIVRGEAAGIASLLGFSAIAGRLTIGHLLDRFQGRYIATVVVCMPVIGSLILIGFPGSVTAASAAVLIFGLSMGAELDILAYLTSRYFRTESFAMMFGTIGGFVALAGAGGPVILNRVYDLTGSYVPALWGVLPVCLLSATLFVLMGPYPTAASRTS
ncbi:MAG: MFS transporter [Novosphingobium sp.]